MARYDLQVRRTRYFTLSSQIPHLDNSQLRSLFDAAETKRGWGRNHVLDIGRSKVFVKRLPPYYNYGVGSAGFGAFRELVANIKTTN